jgi:hypothetical protein
LLSFNTIALPGVNSVIVPEFVVVVVVVVCELWAHANGDAMAKAVISSNFFIFPFCFPVMALRRADLSNFLFEEPNLAPFLPFILIRKRGGSRSRGDAPRRELFEGEKKCRIRIGWNFVAAEAGGRDWFACCEQTVSPQYGQ